MACSELNRVRKRRAECIMEIELWDVINRKRHATRTEALLDRKDILRILAGMSARVANEISWGKK